MGTVFLLIAGKARAVGVFGEIIDSDFGSVHIKFVFGIKCRNEDDLCDLGIVKGKTVHGGVVFADTAAVLLFVRIFHIFKLL